jgi:hypothetical protein
MAVFRAPRPAWTRPPPDVIGVSEPTLTAFLFNNSNARVTGSRVGDPTTGYSGIRATARGRSYYLDNSASDDGRNSANNASPAGSEITVTSLVRADSFDADFGGLWNWTSSAYVGHPCAMFRDSNGDRWRVYADNSVIATMANGSVSPIEDGQWHWVAIVISKLAQTVVLYVDGEVLSSKAAAGIPTSITTSAANNNLVLGNTRNRSATQQMVGDFAAFYALDRAMSPAEVRHRHSPQGQWDWLRTSPQRFIETADVAATGWEYGAGFDRDPVRIRGNPRDVVINGRADSHWATLRRYVP